MTRTTHTHLGRIALTTVVAVALFTTSAAAASPTGTPGGGDVLLDGEVCVTVVEGGAFGFGYEVEVCYEGDGGGDDPESTVECAPVSCNDID